MNLGAIAIASMNYFFLRIVTEKIHDKSVNKEVALFLEQLAKKRTKLDNITLNAMKRELIENDYFHDMSMTDVRHLINSVTDDLTGQPLPEISQFYIDLLIANGQLKKDVAIQEGPVTIDMNGLHAQSPLTVKTIQNVISTATNINYNVKTEDNLYYDPERKEIRVRISYTDKNGNDDTFSLLLPESLVAYVDLKH